MAGRVQVAYVVVCAFSPGGVGAWIDRIHALVTK